MNERLSPAREYIYIYRMGSAFSVLIGSDLLGGHFFDVHGGQDSPSCRFTRPELCITNQLMFL